MTEERDEQQTRAAERRLLAVEMLLESSHLRDNLTDEQAARLLDWGLAQVEIGVKETAVLPDNEAEAQMEEWVTAVSGVMKWVNRLTPELSLLDQEEAEYQMEKLLANLQHLVSDLKTTPALELLLPARSQLDANATFDQLMGVITQPHDTPPQRESGDGGIEGLSFLAPNPSIPAPLEEEE